ncbi:hypothetical protein B8W69_03730 [Mycobacterium vulneris]|uniref:Uncharacterized protein n=1 Tax=Mycolicibacterium vulneris TaxID=547163 RepID=A0A1X2LCB3_9MYCO|nr:hypothetical protein [Mycolicibacterium vulneris]OSC31565.1 hypothetical protein B8W69_03730 [Mycolicibacterium vulneris]
MRSITVGLTVIVGALATVISLSSPAHAGPNPGQCGFAMSFICSMIPALPELDHDIDLTQDANGPNVSGLPPNVARNGG